MSTPIRFGSEFLVNTSTRGAQFSPVTTALADGRFVIAWSDQFGDGSAEGVKAQIFRADGTKDGAEFLVNTTTAKEQDTPAITALANGGFVIAWTDSSETGGESYGSSVRAQVFNPDGSKTGAELIINTDPALSHRDTAITALPQGRFVVSWTVLSETGNDPSGFSIHAQMFNADGTKRGAQIPVNTTTDQNQTNSEIAAFPDGHFIVSWSDASASTPDETIIVLRAQVFNADGAKRGPEMIVDSNVPQEPYAHGITPLADGRFVRAWANDGIHAQVFNADGTAAGEAVDVATSRPELAINPTIDALADGRLIVSWVDRNSTGDDPEDYAIRAQILDPRDSAVTLGGTKLADHYIGTAWADRLSGDIGNDTLIGAAGNDGIKGEDGNDSLHGGDGNDTIFGGNGNDRMRGDAGDDRLVGGAGNDKIAGGLGRDVMTGGLGADDFIFASAADIGNGTTRDIITDFQSGFDDIDLRALQTNGTFIGNAGFSGTAGEVRYLQTTGIVSGDLNGDGVADWSMNITNKATLVAGDFLF